MIATLDSVIKMTSDALNGKGLSDELLLSYLKGETDDIPVNAEFRAAALDDAGARDIGIVLFTLNGIYGLLGKLIDLFLANKKYEFLANMVSQAFATNVYGEKKYVSLGKSSYNSYERHFDRFMEMLITCNIGEELFVPMFVYALDTSIGGELGRWIDPLTEYLYKFCLTDYDKFLAYADASESKFYAYELMIRADKNRTLNLILDKLLFGKDGDKSVFRMIIKRHKATIMPTVEENAVDSSATVRENAYRIMLLFKSEIYIRDRLIDLYYSEKAARLKQMLKKELGIEDDAVSFESVADMEKYCADNDGSIKAPKLKDVRYKDGSVVPYKVIKSLIYHVAKGGLMLPYAAAIADYIGDDDLNTVAVELVSSCPKEKEVYKIYYSLMFGGELVLSTVIGYLQQWIAKGNVKIAGLTIAALGYSDYFYAKNYLLNMLKDEVVAKTYEKSILAGINLLASRSGCTVNDMLDENADSFQFDSKCGRIVSIGGTDFRLTVTDDLEVVIKQGAETVEYRDIKARTDTEKAQKKAAVSMLSAVRKEIKYQTGRLEEAFFSQRKWKAQLFEKNILGNPLAEKIAATLFWGVYDKNNVLLKVFIVHNGKPRNLSNTVFSLDPQDIVGLVHPIELDASTKDLTEIEIFQPFEQIRRNYYYPSDEDLRHNRVNRFHGTLVDSAGLIRILKQNGWRLFKASEDQTVDKCYKTEGGILSQMEFERFVPGSEGRLIALGNVKFYAENEIPKANGQYLTASAPILNISKLSTRFFSEVLLDIYSIIKG